MLVKFIYYVVLIFIVGSILLHEYVLIYLFILFSMQICFLNLAIMIILYEHSYTYFLENIYIHFCWVYTEEWNWVEFLSQEGLREFLSQTAFM